MCQKFTPDELNKMNHQSKNDIICQMQDRLDKLEHDYENLIEQIRLANQQKFGRSTEKLSEITGQLSFFNEPEAFCDETAQEPDIDDVIDESLKKPRKPKKKGQREEDLKDFPQEEIPHDVSRDTLDDTFGAGNWKSMPDEIFWQLRFEPAKWIAEKHIIKVYVGTDGLHQDEFLRGDHPKTLFKGSIATPSLEAAIINSKYVNSMPLDRISRDFDANGLHLSRQTMSNWTVWSAERYFRPVYDLMISTQLQAHVNQCDETTLEVIHDGRPAGGVSAASAAAVSIRLCQNADPDGLWPPRLRAAAGCRQPQGAFDRRTSRQRVHHVRRAVAVVIYILRRGAARRAHRRRGRTGAVSRFDGLSCPAGQSGRRGSGCRCPAAGQPGIPGRSAHRRAVSGHSVPVRLEEQSARRRSEPQLSRPVGTGAAHQKGAGRIRPRSA